MTGIGENTLAQPVKPPLRERRACLAKLVKNRLTLTLSGLGVDCVVGAVSKMIKPSADRRRKNDRNDAEFLARMLSVGNVVEVWVPDDECEAARDLTRALEDARDDLSRAKQRLSKFLLRHGLVFDERTPTGRRKGNWTRAHWSWIESIRC